MKKAFLSFLSDHVYEAAFCAEKMEELFFTDVGAAIGRSRVFIEEIINSIWKLENIEEIYQLKLYEKINYLYNNGYINKDIYESFDVIRRVGNKASHSGSFNDMQLAFSVHKEMYKIGVWYFEVYTSESTELPPYEPPTPPNEMNDISSIVQEQVHAILSNMLKKPNEYLGEQNYQIQDKYDNLENKQENNIELELLNNSYLEREVSRLRISSAEAVENASSFSDFKKYLHVDRPIQRKVEQVIEKRHNVSESNLILICGSVGDGKSHLLAYLNNIRSEWMSKYKVFNDATESYSPTKTALETLEETLENFSDEKIDLVEDKVIIAINLGVLHNFIYREHENYSFNKLRKIIEDSQLFTTSIVTDYENGSVNIISFADYQMYEITPIGVESEYFSKLIKKICVQDDNNPFYVAYKKDKDENRFSMLHENYEFLCNEFVQKQIIQLVIKAMVKYKVSVSSRHFLNFIADLLVPNETETSLVFNQYERLNHSLPSLLFNSKGRSALLDYINKLNPMHYRSNVIDRLLVTLNTLTDWKQLIEDRVRDEVAKNWLLPLATENSLIKESLDQFNDNFIAILYLTDEGFAKEIHDNTYNKYIDYVYSFNKLHQHKVKVFYKNLRNAIFNWKGSPMSDYIFLERLDQDLAIAQKLVLNPRIDHLEELPEVKLQSFKPLITVKYRKDDVFEMLEIDYSLFELLEKVLNGYRPNKKDEEDATTFIEFLDRIMSFGDKKDEIVIDFIAENKKYKLKFDEFETFVFEKVE